MNSKESLKRLREIEKMIEFFKDQKSKSININLGNLGVIKEGKQEAKQIYEKFKDGCRELFQQKGETDYDSCGIYQWFCPNCKEIKKIHFAILGNTKGGLEK